MALVFALPGHYAFTAIIPIPARWPWLLATLPATLLYFASGEILVRSQSSSRAALVADLAHKGLALLSLTAAIFLLSAPFFLALLLPVLVLVFIAFGLLGRWLYQAGHNPLIAACLNALAVSTLMAAVFPLIR
jgi:hypothetical protein